MTAQLNPDDPITFEESSSDYCQNYVLVTFVYPEQQIKKKLMNDLAKFVVYSINKKISESFNSVLKELNIHITNKIDRLTENFKEINKDLKDSLLFNTENFNSHKINYLEYKDLIDSLIIDNYENPSHIHGIKIRGVFSTISEANKYAQDIKKIVEPNIDCLVGNVGHWCIFNPQSLEKIKHKTYDADQNPKVNFNQIMDGYNDNLQQKDNFLLQQEEEKNILKQREEKLLKKSEDNLILQKKIKDLQNKRKKK